MKKIFDLSLAQNEDLEFGDTARGEALVSPVSAGRFRGEHLNGQVLPVGAGITYTFNDTCNDISSMLLLKTDDGAQMIMDMKAYLDIEPSVEAKLIRGTAVDPSEYYYKGIVDFKTGSPDYKWLERKVCVCEMKIDDWEHLSGTVYMV